MAPGSMRRAYKRVRILEVIALAGSLVPLAARAQSEPVHDMGSMPGMNMEAPKSKVGNGKGNEPKVPPGKAKAASAKAASGSASAPSTSVHDTMPGMVHDMPGMAAPVKDEAQPAPAMDHSQMPGMDHSTMPATHPSAMQGISDEPPTDAVVNSNAKPAMDKGSMQGMDMGSMMKSMQGGAAPVDARDPDTYADGLENGHMQGMDMADNATHVQVLLDRVEQFHSSRGNGQAIDAQAWAGGDIDRLWLKIDGERSNGKLGATRTEALWNHAIATYWGFQAGARHDFGDGPGRTWASFGFQGLSPYWFDIQATAYVGQSGRTALRFEGEYDLRITQRLVLQPDVKVSLYGKNDRDRDIGSGLSDIDAGLRVRYELSRKFAPYLGVVWNRKFANTASYTRESGNAVQETRVVAGLRIWF